MKPWGIESKGHAWLGPLIVDWPVNNDGGPLLDGCTITLTDDRAEPYPRRLHYGGVAIRPLRLAVGWRGADTPNPGRWFSPRWVAAHVWWILRGRPARRVRDLFPVHTISSRPIEFPKEGFR